MSFCPADQNPHRTPEAVRPGRASAKPTVWVCIAVFNRIEYTRKCLEQLRDQTYEPIRVVVVDDGSRDGTAEMIASEFPEIILLRGNGSLFWTRAMRLGVSHILDHSGVEDYILLLNDDLLFRHDMVESLVAQSKAHPRSLIQAVESCRSDPDRIWQGGVSLSWWTAKHRMLNYQRRLSDFPPGHCERSDYLTARGVIVEADVFRKIGNYDQRYLQSGDPEFARRAAKNGYNLLVAYDVVVLSYDKGKNFNESEQYSLSDWKRYYFGVLSNYRLSTRWSQAIAMTNGKLQGLTFFLCDFTRITVHFVRRLKSAA